MEQRDYPPAIARPPLNILAVLPVLVGFNYGTSLDSPCTTGLDVLADRFECCFEVSIDMGIAAPPVISEFLKLWTGVRVNCAYCQLRPLAVGMAGREYNMIPDY